MSYSWFKQGTCTVGASDVVRFQSANITTAPNKPVVGDAFTVGGFRFYEIIFIGSDATGEYIRLNRAYEEAAGSNISYAIARFASGTQNAKLVAMASAAINQKQISLDDMYEWYTSQADTVQFLGPDGTITTLTTYFKLSKEITAVGGNSAAITVVANNINDVKAVAANIAAVNLVAPSIPAINTVNTNMPAIVAVNADMVSVKNVSDNMADVKDAKPQADRAESEADRAEVEANKAAIAASALYGMPQAQFEAIRAQNNEKYAASGFVHFGRAYQSLLINQGLWAYVQQSNILFIGARDSDVGESKTGNAVISIAGVITKLYGLGFQDIVSHTKIKFPQAPDGKTTYNKSTSVNTVHASAATAFAAQAVDPTNVEVVTDRVDMWGFEAWLEEVNTTNPYVYPNGLIQSIATTMDGITTSASARPVTYYAVFDGDTGSKGKGLNFFALTDAQKKKVLGNHKNNLYYLDDGRLVQWRLRQRTIAGAGNGDWGLLQSSAPTAILYSGANGYLRLQGKLDSIAAQFGNDDGTIAYSQGSSNNPDYARGGLGLNGARSPLLSDGAECYFLVCGTVNRLNQGAYHPSFNPSGTATRNNGEGSRVYWHQIFGKAIPLNSAADCFNFYDGSGLDGKVTGGSIALGDFWAGRPDGRLYDAIYADGQGGVCRDMRYSAYGVDLVDFAEADQKVKNGAYRGFEKLVFSKAIQGTSGGESDVFGLYYHGSLPTEGTFIISQRGSVKSVLIIGDVQHIYEKSTGLVLSGVVTDVSAAAITCRRIGADIPIRSYSQDSSANFIWVKAVSQPMSIGGSFLQTDVIGNPENILATPALANGWQGSWIPVIPAGSPLTFPMARKVLTSISGVYTTNNGDAWTVHTGFSFDFIVNAYKQTPLGTGFVFINTYQAFAKQTENTTNAAVYGGDAGVGNVYAQSLHLPEFGCIFGESLCGIVCKNMIPPEGVTQPLTRYLRNPNGLFNVANVNQPKHAVLDIVLVPSNNSPAFKALNYNVNINQQAFIQYAYTELKYDGTNWGDDGKVTIVDNQATKMDLNGNTVLVGTAKLKEPIGWVKNKD